VVSSPTGAAFCAAALCACMAGCASAPGDGVDLTLTFADDLDDEAMSSVTAFEFSSDGDEQYEKVLTLDRAAQRIERLRYSPSTATRSLTISVRALDATQSEIAAGATDPLLVQPDRTVSANVLLERGNVATDLSANIDAASEVPDLRRWDGGPISCPMNALLCDGFELGNTSRWTSTFVVAPATLTVDSAMPLRGSFALDTHMPVAAAPAHAAVQFDFSTPADLVSARAYLMAPTAPGNYAAMLAILTANGYFTIATDQSNRWTVTESMGPDHTTGIGMPLNKWNCVELIVDYSGGGNGRVQLYANSALMVDFVPARARTPFVSLQVGQSRAAGNVDARVYVDEVALAPAPIGCQ
jgi:hypothetical protein